MHMHLGRHRIDNQPANNKPEEGKEEHEKHHIPLEKIVLKLHIPHHEHKHGRPEIVIQDLSTALIPILGQRRFAMLLHNFLTPEECEDLIDRVEGEGYDRAFIHGPKGGEVMREDIRFCGRRILDDKALANSWFKRVMKALEGSDLKDKLIHVPWVVESPDKKVVNSLGYHMGKPYEIVCLNERLRFLRYLPGEYFGNHQDNRYFRGPEYGEREGEVSHVTFLLYLNDTKKGGETRVHSGRHGDRFTDVTPKTGSVLLFDLDIWHEATKIITGRKYACRTEFMYTTKPEHMAFRNQDK